MRTAVRSSPISKKSHAAIAWTYPRIVFAFKAGKRGFVLPLIVNLASLAVIAGALLLLSSSFAARESESSARMPA